MSEKEKNITEIKDPEEAKKEIENNLIELPEVINICNKFLKGKISFEDFEEFCDNILIRAYLTFYEKVVCLNKLLFESDYASEDILPYKVMQLEMYKFWYVILSYTNIKIDGYEELLSIDNYDILCPLIEPLIITYTYNDYHKIENIINTTIDYRNLSQLVDGMNEVSKVDFNNLAADTKEYIKIIEENKELITSLSSLINATSMT